MILRILPQMKGRFEGWENTWKTIRLHGLDQILFQAIYFVVKVGGSFWIKLNSDINLKQ